MAPKKRKNPEDPQTQSTDYETPDGWEQLARQSKERVASYNPTGQDLDEKLIRCLHLFIEWLPEGGRESIARDIIGCQDDKQLYDVFKNLTTGLLIPMKTASRRSAVQSSPHTERQDNVDAVAASLPEPESSERDFREVCLQRDGYRCVVTKDMDMEHWVELGEPADVPNADLEVAHIIPFSFASWKDDRGEKDRTMIWEVLYRCFPGVRHVMSVTNINEPYNGITLQDLIHKQFDRFRCAFVSTDTPQKYRLKTYTRFPSRYKVCLPEFVMFQTAPDAQDIELPSGALLDCHHRLAEILNASGMAEVIERRMNKWEAIKQGAEGSLLQTDGSTDISQLLHVGMWLSACV